MLSAYSTLNSELKICFYNKSSRIKSDKYKERECRVWHQDNIRLLQDYVRLLQDDVKLLQDDVKLLHVMSNCSVDHDDVKLLHGDIRLLQDYVRVCR
jgi:hypothetical protein